eukprot:12292-Heterococcus_DN1.PRE.2
MQLHCTSDHRLFANVCVMQRHFNAMLWHYVHNRFVHSSSAHVNLTAQQLQHIWSLMTTSTAELELYLCFLQDTGFSIPATKSAKHINSSSVLECHAAFGPLELAYVFNELICGSSADWTTLGLKAYLCFEAFYHQLLSYCSASATGSGTTVATTTAAATEATAVSDSTGILEEIESDVDMFETDTVTPET